MGGFVGVGYVDAQFVGWWVGVVFGWCCWLVSQLVGGFVGQVGWSGWLVGLDGWLIGHIGVGW